MNREIKDLLTVTYSVDKCTFPSLNGEHTETFDLSKLTDEDIVQYLAQTLIIKRQSQLRSKTAIKEDGSGIKIGTWVVTAPGKRIATDPVAKAKKADELFGGLTLEQKREIAKKYGFAFIEPTIEDEEN